MEIEEEDEFAEDRFVSIRKDASEDDMSDVEQDQSVVEQKEAKKMKSGAMDRSAQNLPLVEKYRPANLDEIVAQEDIILTITNLMEKQALPHLLLYGPPGTGKTSTILALARKLYGTSQLASMVLEMNASDARGIDDIREQVVTFASTRKIFSSGMKLVILDEADNMTRDAQFALRRVIEKYTANTRFCLICNYVSKIIPALQSRCTRFRFSPLDPAQVKDRLSDICVKEQIECSEEAQSALLRLAKGDMRKVLNLLEASSMQRNLAENGKVKVDAPLVYQVAGKPTPDDIDNIVNWLMNSSIRESAEEIGKLQLDKGLALGDIVTEVHDTVLHMKLPNDILTYLFSQLADCEQRLSSAVDEKIQLHGLIAVFMNARAMVKKGLECT